MNVLAINHVYKNINIFFLMSLLDFYEIDYDISIVYSDSITRPGFIFKENKYTIIWPIFSYFGQKSVSYSDLIENYRNNPKLSGIMNFFLQEFVFLLVHEIKKKNFSLNKKSIPRALSASFFYSEKPFVSKALLFSLPDLNFEYNTERLIHSGPPPHLGHINLSFFLGSYGYRNQLVCITNNKTIFEYLCFVGPHIKVKTNKYIFLPTILGKNYL